MWSECSYKEKIFEDKEKKWICKKTHAQFVRDMSETIHIKKSWNCMLKQKKKIQKWKLKLWYVQPKKRHFELTARQHHHYWCMWLYWRQNKSEWLLKIFKNFFQICKFFSLFWIKAEQIKQRSLSITFFGFWVLVRLFRITHSF